MLDREKRLNEVYEHVHRYFNIHTKGEFADYIKYARAYISSALNGNEKYLTDKLFDSICKAFPGVFDLNYLLTGEGQLLTIDVPSSYVGTTGQLAMNIYGLCPATDYTTDVAVSALTQDGSPLSTLTLSDVPLRRNRVTSYSGQLFGHAGALTVSLNDTWEDDLNVTW